MTSFQLRVQKTLVTSDGDIGKIRRVRAEQPAAGRNPPGEPRNLSRNYLKKKVGKAGQIVFLNKLFTDRLQKCAFGTVTHQEAETGRDRLNKATVLGETA